MRGYDEEEVEYYDDYEEDGEEQDDYADKKGEYEEEEDPKPTKEELEYLELRQRLKEAIRKQTKKETGSALNKSQEKKRKFPYDNSGSFFGPSQPVIAQRVIQESKSFLETQHLTPKVSNPYNSNKKSSASNVAGSKAPVRDRPKVVNEVQKKAQRLKDTRDYSFLLSEDAELPAPTKEPLHRNVSAPNSDARSAQAPMKSKQPLGGNNGRHLHGGREERRPVSLNGQIHSKAGSNKFSSSRPNSTSINSRKQLGSNNGNGPGRPVGPKGLPLKTPADTKEKKQPSAPSAKNFVSGVHKPLSSKMPLSVPKHPLERKKESQEPNKGKMLSKQPIMSSKPQMHKPQKQISSRGTLQDNRPKKKPVRRVPHEDDETDEDDETKNAFSIIRNMFKTQRFAGRDDDDSDMEANFEDIMREEKRSERIARREDEEQLRLIEEEERRERERLKRKKLKMRR